MSEQATQPKQEVHYPCSDGKPLGETPLHIRNLSFALITLQHHYREDQQVFIAGNLFVYYVEGDPCRHISPDILVSFDVPKHREPDRRLYLVWEEGKAMNVAIEFTSESTRAEDVEQKMEIYRNLRVREYFLFDPYGEHLDPPLQGYRLSELHYEPLGSGPLHSEVLNLQLESDGEMLHFVNPATGKRLTNPEESYQQILEAQKEQKKAEKALRKAQKEKDKLEAEMEKLRAELEVAKRQAQENGENG